MLPANFRAGDSGFLFEARINILQKNSITGFDSKPPPPRCMTVKKISMAATTRIQAPRRINIKLLISMIVQIGLNSMWIITVVRENDPPC